MRPRKTTSRPRAHRAVGRWPPASWTGRRYVNSSSFRERADHTGRAPDRQSFGALEPSQAAKSPCYEANGASGAIRSIRWCFCSAWRRFRCWACCSSRRSRRGRLSPVRRPADAARHPEFLERRLQPAVHLGRRAGLHFAATCRRLFFLGVFLTGFSSSYYHWNRTTPAVLGSPADVDRFMAILQCRRGADRRQGGQGAALAAGRARHRSLLVWLRTDDLRLYGWVQFFPCLVLPLIFWLFAPKYSGTWYWFAAAGWYLLAKVLEYTDAAIYSAGTSWPATRSSISRRPAPATRSCAHSRRDGRVGS